MKGIIQNIRFKQLWDNRNKPENWSNMNWSLLKALGPRCLNVMIVHYSISVPLNIASYA